MNVKQKLAQAKLYSITPELALDQYAVKVEQACRGGADIVQLRSKTLSALDFFNVARQLQSICARYDTLFIVNDRLDVALMVGAQGVHLGQQDLPIDQARLWVNHYQIKDFVIGCSTHSLDQALRAQKLGADYLGCGPIFATPTKPDYAVVGLDLIQQYRQNIQIPFTAIGGIDLTNIDQVISAGAPCVATLRQTFVHADTELATRQLKERLK